MGARLGVLISQSGKTREAFAPEVGMSPRELYRHIAGRVKALASLDRLDTFARALGMSRDELQHRLLGEDD
jgi:Helix-turn-helix domain